MREFPPDRRGRPFLVFMTICLAAASGVFIDLASHQPIGGRFAILLVAAGLAFFPIPFLVYRFYALSRANYSLDRDRLTLTWGMRVEQIPLSDVEWVRPGEALPGGIKLPLIRLPGSLTGLRRIPELGAVEFMASDEKALLLVATSKKTFAISPRDRTGFLENIQQAIELGSLYPVEASSVFPINILGQAWDNLLTRYLWLAGLLLNIGLLVWVSTMIPVLERIALGFLPSGAPGEPVPGAALILVPIVSLIFFISGWLAGLFFYRRPGSRPVAIVLWTGSVISTIVFLLAVMTIVTTPV